MALVERIMGEPFEPDPARRIPVHEFAAWCYESAFGPRTVAEIKAYFAMTTEDAAEFDAIIAKITGTDAQRHRLVFQLEQVFILAEVRAPAYNTPVLVRSRIGL
jgi:hypothetical protein